MAAEYTLVVGERTFTLPASVVPENAVTPLPELSVNDARLVRNAGFARIGVMAAILDDKGRILTLEHEASEKTPDGALGVLGETAQAEMEDGSIVSVEPSQRTLERGIYEELDIDPSVLKAKAKAMGAWALNAWPVGVSFQGQRALAICPVIHVDSESAEVITEAFTPTEEVRAATFRTGREIEQADNMRPGTKDWLVSVRGSGLLEVRQDLETLVLQKTVTTAGAVDIRFDKLPNF